MKRSKAMQAGVFNEIHVIHCGLLSYRAAVYRDGESRERSGLEGVKVSSVLDV